MHHHTSCMAHEIKFNSGFAHKHSQSHCWWSFYFVSMINDHDQHLSPFCDSSVRVDWDGEGCSLLLLIFMIVILKVCQPKTTPSENSRSRQHCYVSLHGNNNNRKVSRAGACKNVFFFHLLCLLCVNTYYYVRVRILFFPLVSKKRTRQGELQLWNSNKDLGIPF